MYNIYESDWGGDGGIISWTLRISSIDDHSKALKVTDQAVRENRRTYARVRDVILS